MSRYVWLAWLPLVFLPNLTRQIETGAGALEFSDFLIVPYIGLVLIGSRRQRSAALPNSQRLVPLLACFVAWGLLSTVSIVVRYDTNATREVLFGLLKLGKFALYGFAGILTARGLRDERLRLPFDYALLAAGTVVGVSLMVLGSGQGNSALMNAQVTSREDLLALEAALDASKHLNYKATNAISALMAIIICYIVGLWVDGHRSRLWRKVALITLMIMCIGLFCSDGRGGWAAGVLGLGYLFVRRGLSHRTLLAIAAVVVVAVYCYWSYPGFRHQVDITFFPDEEYQKLMAEYGAGIGGVDDGARLITWTHEATKFVNAPILGSGFYNRGRLSGLWMTGSHNFFLQMFLETGAVGGVLVLVTLGQMWRQAGSAAARGAGLELPLKAALVAALAGGMTGEYFYGGIVLLSLFLVYAPVGALPRSVFFPAARGPIATEDRAFAPDMLYHPGGPTPASSVLRQPRVGMQPEIPAAGIALGDPRCHFKTAGDDANSAQTSEQNGIVALSGAVVKSHVSSDGRDDLGEPPASGLRAEIECDSTHTPRDSTGTIPSDTPREIGGVSHVGVLATVNWLVLPASPLVSADGPTCHAASTESDPRHRRGGYEVTFVADAAIAAAVPGTRLSGWTITLAALNGGESTTTEAVSAVHARPTNGCFHTIQQQTAAGQASQHVAAACAESHVTHRLGGSHAAAPADPEPVPS